MSKKKSADDGEAKEHKPNWREVYATVGEIKAFLSDHVYLRYNTVKHRVEARVPPGDPFIENSELNEFISDTWQPMSDRLRSTLLMVLKTLKDLSFLPSEALVVGDMPVDIEMGKRAGAKTCGVTYGNSGRAALEAAEADYIIDSITELPGIF